METQIRELLDTIRHPETEQGIVSSGFLEEVKASPERIVAVLRFTKARDPFAAKSVSWPKRGSAKPFLRPR